MGINRRDIVQMPGRENDLLKARNQKLDDRMTRHQQAFRALNAIWLRFEKADQRPACHYPACLRLRKRLDMSSGKLDDNDLAILCLSAGF